AHLVADAGSFDIINAKAFVGNEENRDIRLGAGAMRHDLPFGKPDEGSRSERSLVCHQPSFQNIQAVTAWVRMFGIHETGRVANQPNLCPGLWVGVEFLAENRLSDLLVV